MRPDPIAIATVFAFSTTSFSHDFWENGGRVDPATKTKCCGKADCYAFKDGKPEPTRVNGGYSMVNKWGIRRFVSDPHVQPSPDGYFHACEWGTAPLPEGGEIQSVGTGDVKRFFAPRNF